MDEITRHVDPTFAPSRTLDFGCGVGRVAIPLARRFEHVVGLDVSPGMLTRAAEAAQRQGVGRPRGWFNTAVRSQISAANSISFTRRWCFSTFAHAGA